MRRHLFFALVGIFCAVCSVPPAYATAADQDSEEHPNYVVIGAFRIHRNATRFTQRAQSANRLDARYELNRNRNLYYVYVLSTPDRTAAIAEARRLRAQSEYTDTWVFSGYLGRDAVKTLSPGTDINPESERGMDEVRPADSPDAGQTIPVVSADASPTATTALPSAQPAPKSLPAADEASGKKFFFRLYRGMDQKQVDGDVDIIHQERLRKLGTYKGNMEVKVGHPGGSTNIAAVCEVFGYRKVQRDFDYGSPEGEDIAVTPEGAVMVPFELVRLQKGDIAVMYNVYFFKDAAVMRPESRYEVNSLLEMLRENEKYRIRIHGHTNGKASGRIIYPSEEEPNFFSLSRTREGYGSARKLSEERAAMIRDFLASNGIDPARMEVKAWGGKRPIHDKHSTRAQENVRVEIEILED